MRILWLSHLVPYPPKGGVLQRSYNLLRELAHGNTVDLISFVQKPMMEMVYPEGAAAGEQEAYQALSEICRHVTFIDLPCDDMRFGRQYIALKSLFSPLPYSINWMKSDSYSNEIRKYTADTDYDLIHVDTIGLASYRQSLSDASFVLDHHNIESHMMLRRAQTELNPLKRFYYYQEGAKLRRFEQRICSEFDLHITCSDLDSDRLHALIPDINVLEIPNGVDLEYFKPDISAEEPCRLIFVGALSWYPNREAVLFIANKLWPRLKSEIPNVSIDIVGANPPEKLTELSAVDSAFRVHGFVNDVRPYLDRASIYVCPISDGGGTKLKMLDAFAMQLPVVAHPASCEGLETIPGEHLVLAEHTDDFVSAIKDLVNDKERRRNLGLQARQLVESKFSFSAIGCTMRQAYSNIVHGQTSTTIS